MKEIKIPLGEKSYSVFIGDNIISLLPKEIKKRNLKGKILLITDSNVNSRYKNFMENILQQIDNSCDVFVIKPGEESKSPEKLNEIYSFMISKNYGRDSFIIAFGGGIVGDLAGYAAATYMRGIPFIQIPTTLLAAVDSSVGGKTGINFAHTKNVIGSFHQPMFVIVDMKFLQTLPPEEVLCGAGEIVKYAFLSTTSFYNYVEKNIDGLMNKDPAILKKVIIESILIKGAVVSQDEKETGLRKILNLGHTFAHGFESILNYHVKHGEAVIAGIGCALFLSSELGLLNKLKLDKYISFLKKVNINLDVNALDKEQLLNAMLKDKKNREGKIKFVLIKDIGELLTDIEANTDQVKSALSRFGALN